MRRVAVACAAAVLVVVLALNSARWFSNDSTRTPVQVEPRCNEMEAMWLQAQAVPSAQLVPCVASLPVGWSFGELTVNNGRSTITVDHDRAGSGAIDLHFARSCDTTNTTEAPADVPELDLAAIEGLDLAGDGEAEVHLPLLLGAAFGLSTSEARRLLAQGAVKLDGETVPPDSLDVPFGELAGRVLQAGKRRFAAIPAKPG